MVLFFPRLPSEFSWTRLLFPPGNPVWVEFRDFGQLSGISGHLAIHLKQDGKFYTCLCPHADDASSTCRGYCTDPRSTVLQSVCYTGGLGENGNSSLFGKTGVTVSLLGSECPLVLLCPSHRGWFHEHMQSCLSQTKWAIAQTTHFFTLNKFLGCSVLCPLPISPTPFCLGRQKIGDSCPFMILLDLDLGRGMVLSAIWANCVPWFLSELVCLMW